MCWGKREATHEEGSNTWSLSCSLPLPVSPCLPLSLSVSLCLSLSLSPSLLCLFTCCVSELICDLISYASVSAVWRRGTGHCLLKDHDDQTYYLCFNLLCGVFLAWLVERCQAWQNKQETLSGNTQDKCRRIPRHPVQQPEDQHSQLKRDVLLSLGEVEQSVLNGTQLTQLWCFSNTWSRRVKGLVEDQRIP